jgi:hypothetical protein
MKRLLFSVLLVLFIVSIVQAEQAVLVGAGKVRSTVTGTFGNSEVDTVIWVREPGVTAIAFGIQAADTIDMSTTTAVRRIINGVAVTALAADTLANAEALAGTDYLVPVASLDAVTLAPLAEQYWFIVTYHSTANGTGTTNVVRYFLEKQYAK